MAQEARRLPHPGRQVIEIVLGHRGPEAIRGAGGNARRLVAVGGGTRGGLRAQVVPDVTGGSRTYRSQASVQATATPTSPVPRRPGTPRSALGKGGGDRSPQRRLPAPLDRLYQIYLQLYPATRASPTSSRKVQLTAATPTPQSS